MGKENTKKMTPEFKTMLQKGSSLVVLLEIVALFVVENIMDGGFVCPCGSEVIPFLKGTEDIASSTWSARGGYASAYFILPTFILLFTALTAFCKSAVDGSFKSQMKILVAPFAWLIFAFMDGRYYACAVAELPAACDPCNLTRAKCSLSDTAYEKRERLLQGYSESFAVSRMIGLGVACFLSIITCTWRIFSDDDDDDDE